MNIIDDTRDRIDRKQMRRDKRQADSDERFRRGIRMQAASRLRRERLAKIGRIRQARMNLYLPYWGYA